MALVNIKTAIISRGGHHGGQKHIPRYLAEFAYRFNRRYDLAMSLSQFEEAVGH